jgi:hypothetical protein
MNTPNSSGVVLILIFAGILMLVIFLIMKQRSKGILGNRLVLFGAIIVLLVFTIIVKGPIIKTYGRIFKSAPYSFSELKSFVFKYGPGDSLVNQYNSSTGDYQYIDKTGKIVKKKFYLSTKDLLYLHHKAVEIGFWDFPANEQDADTTFKKDRESFKFFIQLNYKRKSKTVLFSTSYPGTEELMEANREFITDIQNVLSKAEERQKK